MSTELEKALATLRDDAAMWTQRRDAVELLGKTAAFAVHALREHEEDRDTDVRLEVERALRDLDSPVAGPVQLPPPTGRTEPENHSLDALAESCAKPKRRLVEKTDDGYAIRVQIDAERWQTVHLAESTGPNKMDILRIATTCGPAEPRAVEWAMKSNARLVNCSFALEDRDGTPTITLVENLDRRWATPATVRAAVKEVAFYGDFLEKRLTGLDEL